MKTRRAIGVIILQDDECLLVKKVKVADLQTKFGIWDFPKGGVEPNESLEQALFRELKEETGSNKYQIIKLFDEKITFPFDEKQKNKIGFDR
ncbi:NUDIX hydrolase [Heyndrickxia sporothermodurans]